MHDNFSLAGAAKPLANASNPGDQHSPNPSHRKLLWSRAMVGSVAETSVPSGSAIRQKIIGTSGLGQARRSGARWGWPLYLLSANTMLRRSEYSPCANKRDYLAKHAGYFLAATLLDRNDSKPVLGIAFVRAASCKISAVVRTAPAALLVGPIACKRSPSRPIFLPGDLGPHPVRTGLHSQLAKSQLRSTQIIPGSASKDPVPWQADV